MESKKNYEVQIMINCGNKNKQLNHTD